MNRKVAPMNSVIIPATDPTIAGVILLDVEGLEKACEMPKRMKAKPTPITTTLSQNM